MLNQSSINDLINFIKLNNNNLCKSTRAGEYYQSFCINCGDYERKSNPDHGHLNIMFKELRCKCWRCDKSSSLLQFVLDLGYSNQDVIKELKSIKSQFGYNISRTAKNKTGSTNINNINLHNKYYNFKKRYPNEFKTYLNYIKYRCGDINPIKYGLAPLINNDNKLLIEFYSSSGYPITARYINSSNNGIRYIKYKNGGYYYYQDIKDITDTKSITIGEGIFDIINLSNYYLDFKSSFFFAMNNSQYTSILKYLIGKYFLIGKYNFNIVFDQDIQKKNINAVKLSLNKIKNQLNPECKLRFYIPSLTKDVSELMILEER
ncbi:MAG: hypothetical protein H8D97_01500 [Proteobacteria bacterium]|nr:hypothetical protein [Pseudomonadota bacterium]